MELWRKEEEEGEVSKNSNTFHISILPNSQTVIEHVFLCCMITCISSVWMYDAENAKDEGGPLH